MLWNVFVISITILLTTFGKYNFSVKKLQLQNGFYINNNIYEKIYRCYIIGN